MKIITNHGIPSRDESLPYNENAPGLYPDETVFLVNNRLVAVSVEPHLIEGGQGLALHGYARLMNEDGSTVLVTTADKSVEVETALTQSFPSSKANEIGVDIIAREFVFALLGESQTMNEDGETSLLMLAPRILEEASIKNAINNLTTVSSGIDISEVF